MSSVNLIQPLLQGSGLLSQCATKATTEKNARQLLSASLKFLDLARRIRLGQLTIAEADVPHCLKEISDAVAAATKAAEEADYPGVIVEANEAIDVIAMHAGGGILRSASPDFAAGAFGRLGNPGLTPVPDPDSIPWPPSWPVWPRPRPRPWGPGGPWGPDGPWGPGGPWGPQGPWGPGGPWGPSGPDPRVWDHRSWAGGGLLI